MSDPIDIAPQLFEHAQVFFKNFTDVSAANTDVSDVAENIADKIAPGSSLPSLLILGNGLQVTASLFRFIKF